MTPARRAWLDSRDVARSGTTQTDVGSGVSLNGGTEGANAQGSPTPAQPDPKTEVVEINASGALASEAAVAPVPAVPSTSALPSQEAPANALQNQINQMQQLFEERKKMIANPGVPRGTN